MNKASVVIVGAGGHAKVVIDCIEKEGKYRILGFTDTGVQSVKELFGYPFLGNDSVIPELLDKNPQCALFIAAGDNFVRTEICKKLNTLVLNPVFASTIHPSAQIAKGVTIGKGVVVMAGAVLNSDCTVGDFCIVNTNASLDHDSTMDDFSSLAPGAVCGGNVHLGLCSAVSIGATVSHGIRIGKHSILGAGAVLLNSVGDHVVCYGVPAKEIRTRKEGDRYL